MRSQLAASGQDRYRMPIPNSVQARSVPYDRDEKKAIHTQIMRLRGFRSAIATLFLFIGSVLRAWGGGGSISIVTQPASQTVPSGGTATLSVGAIAVTPAGNLPLSYQWRHAGTNLPIPIVRMAGGSLKGGAAATSVCIGNPSAVVADTSGNVFIADSLNSVIRKIDTQGIITTVAGRYPGAGGYSGDGGPAVRATLSQPGGLAVDAYGNLFIADTLNHAVRKVSSRGTITTIAGNGNPGYSGDGGRAANASLNGPAGVAVDASGNLFIADRNNHVIRKVTSSGVISTIVGTGPGSDGFFGDGGLATAAKLNSPVGVAIDSTGNLLIADYGNSIVRKVDTGGLISTIAGICFENFPQPGYTGDGGAATAATLFHPAAVAVDAQGILFIADSYAHVVRRVDANGIITTVAGSGVQGYTGDGGTATAATLNGPVGVAVGPQGRLFIAEPYNYAVRQVITSSGTITTFAGNGSASGAGDGGSAILATLSGAGGVALDLSGNLLIADTYNHSIRRVSTSGTISTLVGTGMADYSGDGGLGTAATLNTPNGLAVDSAGNIFIADTLNHAIRKLDTSGIISTVAGTGVQGYGGNTGPAINGTLNSPNGVTVDSAGNLFIADTLNNVIRKVDTSGNITTFVGNGVQGFGGDGGPGFSASFNHPAGVAKDSSGNLFIADALNNVIRKVSSGGTVSTFAGTGVAGYSGDGGPALAATFQVPIGVSLDSLGNILIADFANNVIRQLDPQGTVTTVAGNGSAGYSGEGASATGASLFGPSAVTADSSGNIFIADSNNAMVRKVTAFGPTFVVPSVEPTSIGSYDVVISTTGLTATSQSASVSISGSGSSPIAVNDALTRPDNSQVVKVPLSILLANDQDPGNQALSITATGNAQPSGATVVISEGFAIYTVPSGSFGDGSFSYTVSNGTFSSIGIVTITQTSSSSVSSGPTAVSITAVGADFAIKFLGVPGLTYGIQYTTNPNSPYTWHEFIPPASVNASANGLLNYTDVAPTDPLRLYRAVQQP